MDPAVRAEQRHQIRLTDWAKGTLLPTPTASDANGAGDHGDGGADLRSTVALLPTPRATDGSKGGPNQRGSKGDPMLSGAVALLPTPTSRDHKGPNQRQDTTCLHGALLPTPTATDAKGSRNATADRSTTGHHSGTTLTDAVRADDADGHATFAEYWPAIDRWQRTLGREAPAHTSPGPRGGERLDARFVEWLMGLPAGHVCDVPGLPRSAQLKALGNGVVPQQAAIAILRLLPMLSDAAEAA